jgi:hypothetical protein
MDDRNVIKLLNFGGWSAVVSGIATIVGFVTLIAFFALGEPWGTINDITSIFLALSIVPVLLTLHRNQDHFVPVFSLAAFVIGVMAMLVAASFQTLLVLRVIEFAQTAIVVPGAFAVFGVSLLFYSYTTHAIKSLPRRLTWLGMISGTGYILVIAGIFIGGQENPLTAIGGFTAVICYPIWAILYSRILLSISLTK